MRKHVSRLALALGAAGALAFGVLGAAAVAAPKKGGILKYVIPSNPPSADAHRETTFGTVHPFAQFYSTLVRVNPDNPGSPTDFKCDLCVGDVPAPTNGGKKYTFKIRKGVKWHKISDARKTSPELKAMTKLVGGKELNAHDVVATFKKIVNPMKGVASARKAFFLMVDKVSAPDNNTVVFDLKYPSGAFIPALSMPYNFVYAKKILDKNMHFFEKNVLGSGPFQFVEWQPGSHINAERNPNYYYKGKPYLDGTSAIFAKKYSVNLQAIRGGRAYIQFRGFPPKNRDDLVKAMGSKLTVQESDWNCVLNVTPNNKAKPFDDVRVRRALTLAIDRWGGSKYLSKIAIVKTVGGIAYPSHPLGATKAELQKLAGFWPDLKKSRAEAKRLLKEAGYPNGFSFTLHNRAVDQPYKIVGTWLIDQWRQVGLKVKQRVQPTAPFYATLRRKKDFDVSMSFNCQSIVNPLLDVSMYQSDSVASNNNASYQDPKLDAMFDKMNRSGDPAEQRRIMRQYEKRAISEMAYQFPTLWWYRIILHRTALKGWKTSPSHYLNVDLSNIWLEEPLRSESMKK
jgi:peptide/nickel transport system substrate-binding protein